MAILKIGGNAEKEVGRFILPVDGAVGVYFTNTSNTKLSNNFVYGQLSNNIVGSPSINDDYTNMSINTGFLQTATSESRDITIFAIYKQPATVTNGAMLCSNYGAENSNQYGISLQVREPDKLEFLACQIDSTGTEKTGAVKLAASGWTLACARVNGNTNTLKNLTTNTKNAGSLVSRADITNNALLRVGASYASNYNDALSLMSVAIFNRALSDSEINIVAEVLRKYAAKHNVTI